MEIIQNNKRRNNEIVVLRFLAIVLIVYHHSIQSIEGWPPVDVSLPSVPSLLHFTSSVAKSLGLVLFTFVSGFLVCYIGKGLSWNFVWKKIKKILVPCVIVAICYWLLFPNMMYDNDPINGTHLWYLPMIFVFYLLSPSITGKSVNRNFWLVLGAYVLFELCSVLSLNRTFQECVRYWPVFIGGGYFSRFYSDAQRDYGTLGILCLIIFFLDYTLSRYMSVLLLCCVLYLFLRKFMQNRNIPNLVNIISDVSFEIYLFHQFVINTLLLMAIKVGLTLTLVPALSFLINLTVLPLFIFLVRRVIFCLIRRKVHFYGERT